MIVVSNLFRIPDNIKKILTPCVVDSALALLVQNTHKGSERESGLHKRVWSFEVEVVFEG